jgi:hypothetical protein
MDCRIQMQECHTWLCMSHALVDAQLGLFEAMQT